MPRGISISWVTSPYRHGLDDGIRVRITVVCSTNVPRKVFAYRTLPRNPRTNEEVGYFDHVCTPADLEDYPEDAPLPGHRPKWFRLDYVDVLLRSYAEVEAFIDDVRTDLDRLVATLDRMDQLTPGGTATLGVPCNSGENP